ncbi:HPF/RaiA family ribosome-associated protein [Pleomorphovibrio marinus]|uniref:HPF/RaiA family ribosome-associated protein n=1 Tax=Pleomorphovibrio marinus TaxID=2164132 RepID=UPI000E0A83DE|nr:HPF/RaiA family ribosome-associated protein [Pleomorphovibrio marinus]
MNYTENYKGVKIDVQAPTVDISDAIQEEIRGSIDKLLRFTAKIKAFDVYFKIEGQGSTSENTMGIRLGVPGPTVFADEKGENWVPMMKSITDKLIRQLQKNK